MKSDLMPGAVPSSSEWPLAARVRSQVNTYGICDGQSDIWASFLRVLKFPLPGLITFRGVGCILLRYNIK
jgi:hypothetical protein